MMSGALSERTRALAEAGRPYVLATVVRAQRPTSVQPGDAALVLGDGTIDGFVGGTCAEQSVRLHALRALETHEPLLLRILPGDGEAPASDGAVTVHNPCISGGAIEIFLEPVTAPPRVVVVGGTPVATALAQLGRAVDLEIAEGDPAAGDLAVVVAAHGREELPILRSALEAGVPYVALVASRRRGVAVLAELREAGIDDGLLARVETPAGLDIGARTPGEIAVSILARIVAVRRAEAPPIPAAAAPETARDPVCGMTVAVIAGAPRAEHEGAVTYFCCDGCRTAFVQDPGRFAAAP
jgi:xanthine dehydrogenase accessory factor